MQRPLLFNLPERFHRPLACIMGKFKSQAEGRHEAQYKSSMNFLPCLMKIDTFHWFSLQSLRDAMEWVRERVTLNTLLHIHLHVKCNYASWGLFASSTVNFTSFNSQLLLSLCEWLQSPRVEKSLIEKRKSRLSVNNWFLFSV